MIKKECSRLSFLFTFITGFIFTFALLGAVYFIQEKNKRNQWDNFQVLFYNLTGMVQKEKSISYLDLYEFEDKNNIIIYIEDNNCKLTE